MPPAFAAPTIPLRAARPPRAACARLPTTCATATPPKRVGAVAKDLQTALQAALRARVSRLSVQLPPLARLGTEQVAPLTPADADRQLARVLAAMFEGTGLSVRVVFPDAPLRDAARTAWGPTAEASLEHWGRRQRRSMRGFADGEVAAKGMEADVSILVGGGAAFLTKARALAKSSGPERLVILANANSDRDALPKDLASYREEAFEAVYHYQPDPHPTRRGGVLFRKFPYDWVLCRLTALGTLQQLLVASEKPPLDHIGAALDTAAKDSSPLGKLSDFIGRALG